MKNGYLAKTAAAVIFVAAIGFVAAEFIQFAPENTLVEETHAIEFVERESGLSLNEYCETKPQEVVTWSADAYLIDLETNEKEFFTQVDHVALCRSGWYQFVGGRLYVAQLIDHIHRIATYTEDGEETVLYERVGSFDISPDGERIAYGESPVAWNGEIVIADIASGKELVRLTEEELFPEEYESYPDRDGRYLYISGPSFDRSGGVWVSHHMSGSNPFGFVYVDPGGNVSKELELQELLPGRYADRGFPADVAFNEKQNLLAFTDGQKTRGRTRSEASFAGEYGNTRTLYVVDLDAGKLAVADTAEGHAFAPFWNRKGELVVADQDGSSTVVVNTDDLTFE